MENLRKTIDDMSLHELEDEYEKNASTAYKITRKDVRQFEMSTALLRKYKEKIDELCKPKED